MSDDEPNSVNMADEPASLDISQTVFPVVATVPGRETELERPDFFGTAFAVGPGVYMTAEHVVRAAEERGTLAIAGPTPHGMVGGAKVVHREVWRERDVALLYCETATRAPLTNWLTHRVQPLTDLFTFGYPHAVTHDSGADRFEVVFRAYKGHVVTTRGFERLDGKPGIYEISCPYPEGLSGAPVLLELGGEIAVAGMVIGTQTITYGGVDAIVGIAIIGDEILELRSERLGDTIARGLRLNAAAVVRMAPEGPNDLPNSR